MSYSKDQWETLHTVLLSDEGKKYGHQKCIVLKKYNNPRSEDVLLLADIRAFMNNKPTQVGICLTPYEFDWLAKCLLYSKDEEQTLKSKSSPRSITIEQKPRKIGVKITQRVDDKARRINLFKREISKLVQNYGYFYQLIEDMEEKAYEQDGDDIEKENSEKEETDMD
jgi:hypothetical protein